MNRRGNPSSQDRTASSTSSPLCPTTTRSGSGRTARTAWRTCQSTGRPQTGWRTLGVRDFSRLPLPAAMTTAARRGGFLAKRAPVRAGATFVPGGPGSRKAARTEPAPASSRRAELEVDHVDARRRRSVRGAERRIVRGPDRAAGCPGGPGGAGRPIRRRPATEARAALRLQLRPSDRLGPFSGGGEAAPGAGAGDRAEGSGGGPGGLRGARPRPPGRRVPPGSPARPGPPHRGGSKFSTWLFQITRNCAVDAIRRRERQRRRDKAAAPDPEPDRDPGLRAAIDQAIERLPPELREAFVLIEVFGLSYRETGVVLGVLAGTLKSRMHRARRLLVTALEEADADEV